MLLVALTLVRLVLTLERVVSEMLEPDVKLDTVVSELALLLDALVLERVLLAVVEKLVLVLLRVDVCVVEDLDVTVKVDVVILEVWVLLVGLVLDRVMVALVEVADTEVADIVELTVEVGVAVVLESDVVVVTVVWELCVLLDLVVLVRVLLETLVVEADVTLVVVLYVVVDIVIDVMVDESVVVDTDEVVVLVVVDLVVVVVLVILELDSVLTLEMEVREIEVRVEESVVVVKDTVADSVEVVRVAVKVAEVELVAVAVATCKSMAGCRFVARKPAESSFQPHNSEPLYCRTTMPTPSASAPGVKRSPPGTSARNSHIPPPRCTHTPTILSLDTDSIELPCPLTSERIAVVRTTTFIVVAANAAVVSAQELHPGHFIEIRTRTCCTPSTHTSSATLSCTLNSKRPVTVAHDSKLKSFKFVIPLNVGS